MLSAKTSVGQQHCPFALFDWCNNDIHACNNDTRANGANWRLTGSNPVFPGQTTFVRYPGSKVR